MYQSIRVASVPERYPYVEHIGWRGDGIDRIDARATRSWIRRHSAEFDLMHIQSGAEAEIGPSGVADLVNGLREERKPLVYTVHGLEHRPGSAEVQSDLIRLSDLVITLTDEMKAQIFVRDGRNSIVVPHPHVVPLRDLERRAHRRQIPPFTLGVQLSSLEGNAVAEALVEAVAERVRESACYRARVDVEAGGRASGALPAPGRPGTPRADRPAPPREP